MPIPVVASELPLAFDALPAFKVRHYHGLPAGGGVYTLARMYACSGQLMLSLCAFERAPAAQSRIGLALCGEEVDCVSLLRLSLSPTGVRLWLEGPQDRHQDLAPPVPEYIAGEDEQGWYWGANLTLRAEALGLAGLNARPGHRFAAALYKTNEDEEAYGVSHRPADPARPFDPREFDCFEIVAY